LGTPTAEGNDLQVPGLSTNTAFQISCDGSQQTAIQMANVPKFTGCSFSGVTVSAGSPSGVARNAEHSLNLPSVFFPADVSSIDLRVRSIRVDDYSPKLFVSEQLAGFWQEGAQDIHNITGLNYQLSGVMRGGENRLRCQMMNNSGRGNNPVSCTFNFDGSYLTKGSCINILTGAP
jgi:hypothetical protein